MATAFRPRLLPVVAVAATVLLGLKVADLLAGGTGTMTENAHAQAAAPSSAATPNPPVAPGVKAAQTGQPSSTPPSTSAASIDPQSLSASEIDVLQQLSQRRAELDQRAGELDQREVLLQAAEKRIDEKIAKLQDLQSSITGDVQKRDAEDDQRIQSLVKIYEAMKPKDAAQIFEQLEMPVLLSVLGRMKELKTAPILAAMDPVKAKAVTTALAAKHNQTDATQGAAATPAGAPGF